MPSLFSRSSPFFFQMFLCKLLYLSALLLILVPLIISLPHPHHDVHKRSSFFDIDCKGERDFPILHTSRIHFVEAIWITLHVLGVFNKSIFFRLDRICEDCYSLFREVELHSLCKWVSGFSPLRKSLSSQASSRQFPALSEIPRFIRYDVNYLVSRCLTSRKEYPIMPNKPLSLIEER